MATGASNLSAFNFQTILQVMAYPNDAIPRGYVCVYDTSSIDQKSVVLPGNPLQLNAGRGFYGINLDDGTSVPGADNQITVAKLGVIPCALKANTACVRGTTAAYDPADGGTIVPYTAAKQVPIGRFQQSYTSSAYVQLVAVELHAEAAAGAGLIGDVIVSSSPITGNAEIAYDQKVTVPANTLAAGSVLKISAKVRQTAVNGTDTLTSRVRFGGLAGVVLGVSPVIAGSVGGLTVFELVATVRSATAMTSGGFSGTASTVITAGSVGPLTIDTTVANDIVVTGIFSSASAGDTAVLEDLTVTVSGPVS